MRFKLGLPLLLAAAVAACQRPAAKPGSLDLALRGAARSPLCSPHLPADWTSTWPVPTGGKGGAEYKVLFYALDRKAQDASGMPRVRVMEPRGYALFTADGKVSTCESRSEPARPLAGERYADALMQLDESEFDKATSKLLRLTEQVSSAYAGKTPADKALLSAYWEQFRLMAEPALWAHYYRAQPGFWEWLAREHGESLPPVQ